MGWKKPTSIKFSFKGKYPYYKVPDKEFLASAGFECFEMSMTLYEMLAFQYLQLKLMYKNNLVTGTGNCIKIAIFK